MFRRCLLALLMWPLLLLPATAQDRLSDLVQLQVIDGGRSASGQHLAALHFTLKSGWKTYWRAPGDAGIPPHFSWQGSRNLRDVDVVWPAPVIFDQGGEQSVGYANQLVLPLRVTPKSGARGLRLKGEVFIGICKHICVPATLRFDQTLDQNAPRSPLIASALAERPYSEAEAGVRQATCTLAPNARGLQIEVRITMPSAGAPEQAVIEPGNPNIWASPTKTTRRGDVLITRSELVHNSNRSAFALDRSAVRVTVLGRKHAVDIQGCAPG